MTTTGKFVITYTGNGIVRLPRAGIFQTGTRAVVDEIVARIATAHGCFAVVSLDAPPPLPVVPEVQPPAAAPTRPTRQSKAIRTVRPSEAMTAVDADGRRR